MKKVKGKEGIDSRRYLTSTDIENQAGKK